MSTVKYSLDSNFVSTFASSPVFNPFGVTGTDTTATVLGKANKAVYSFSAGSGIQLDKPMVTANNYSLELVFKFNETTGYRRIADFMNRTSDFGFYTINNVLTFYNVTGASGGTLQSGYNHVVLTRALNNTTTVYLNGTQAFSFNDTNGYADLSDGQLYLFKDDGNEDASGAVDFVGLYDGVLTAAEVSSSYQSFVIPNQAPTITSGATANFAENGIGTAYTVTATDPEGTTPTYSLSGTDAGLFNINATTGAVTFKTAPNFEAPTDSGVNNVYDIAVNSTDGSLSASKAVAITVTNVNEAPTITSGATANFAENDIGTAYTVTATDPEGTTPTYSLSGTDAGLFNINATTGAVTFKTAPNFEAPTDSGVNNVYDIAVNSTDGSLSASKAVAITVTNVNEAPTITSGATANFAENDIGTAYTVTATDPEGTTPTYSLSGTDAGLFNINATTGAVTFKTAPNFEAPTDSGVNNVYDIAVNSTDGSLSASKAVAITVTNVNEAPTITSGATANFAENDIGTAYTVTATDPEGTTPTYSLSGTDAGLFNINATTGAVTFKTAPNFEAPTDSGVNNVYDIAVNSSDGSLSASKAVAITVTNENETPTNITLSSNSIAENQTIGTVIGTLSTTDPDVGNTHTYSLVDGDTSAFIIDGNQLKANAIFDFETKNSYSVTLRTTDQSGASYDKTLAIGITNVNENETPTNITLSSNSIAENQTIGTVIGTLSTTDPDVGNTHTYSLVDGDTSAFIIDGNQLKANTIFDFETKNSYSVTLRTTDQSGASYDKTLAIGITNVNENETPTNITLSSNSIAENQTIGTVIGTLSTTDPDVGNTHTYSLVDGDTSAFIIDGNQLKANTIFDFETKNSYSVTLRTTDQSGASYDKTLAIGITNVNENETPTNITLSSNSIAENKTIGTVVGTLSTTDADVGNTHTYSIVSGVGDAGAFTLVGNQLKNNVAFDFETKNSYTVRIRTTDQGGLSYEKDFTVNVSNVNEKPTNLVLSSNSISEDQAIGTVIGTLSTSDPDVGNTHTYNIVSGVGDAGAFTISGNQLKSNAAFDFETKKVYSVKVRTTDQRGLSYEKDLIIKVTDGFSDNPTGNNIFTHLESKGYVLPQATKDVLTLQINSSSIPIVLEELTDEKMVLSYQGSINISKILSSFPNIKSIADSLDVAGYLPTLTNPILTVNNFKSSTPSYALEIPELTTTALSALMQKLGLSGVTSSNTFNLSLGEEEIQVTYLGDVNLSTLVKSIPIVKDLANTLNLPATLNVTEPSITVTSPTDATKRSYEFTASSLPIVELTTWIEGYIGSYIPSTLKKDFNSLAKFVNNVSLEVAADSVKIGYLGKFNLSTISNPLLKTLGLSSTNPLNVENPSLLLGKADDGTNYYEFSTLLSQREITNFLRNYNIVLPDFAKKLTSDNSKIELQLDSQKIQLNYDGSFNIGTTIKEIAYSLGLSYNSDFSIDNPSLVIKRSGTTRTYNLTIPEISPVKVIDLFTKLGGFSLPDSVKNKLNALGNAELFLSSDKFSLKFLKDFELDLKTTFDLNSKTVGLISTPAFINNAIDGIFTKILGKPNPTLSETQLSLIKQAAVTQYDLSGSLNNHKFDLTVNSNDKIALSYDFLDKLDLGTVVGGIPILEDFEIGGVRVIVSNSSDYKITYPNLGTFTVDKGVNLLGNINFGKQTDVLSHFIEKKLGVKKLAVQVGFNPDPQAAFPISMRGNIDTDISLLPSGLLNARLTGAGLALKVDSKLDPQFEINGNLLLKNYDFTQKDEPQLSLRGGLQLELGEVTGYFNGTLASGWKNPFGFQGATISKLKFQLGGNPAGFDNFGFIGDLKWGAVDVEVAFAADVTDPNRLALILTPNQAVSLVDLWTNSFSLALQNSSKVPNTKTFVGYVNTALDILDNIIPVQISAIDSDRDGHLDPLIKYVPFATEIAGETLEPGFGINGIVSAFDKNITLSLNSDTSLTKVKGDLKIPEIDLKVLTITGVNDADLNLSLEVSKTSQYLKGDGSLEIFGKRVAGVGIEITPTLAKLTKVNFGLASILEFKNGSLSVDVKTQHVDGRGSIVFLGKTLTNSSFSIDKKSITIKPGTLGYDSILSLNNTSFSFDATTLDGEGTATVKIGSQTLANTNLTLDNGNLTIEGSLAGIDLGTIFGKKLGTIGVDLGITIGSDISNIGAEVTFKAFGVEETLSVSLAALKDIKGLIKSTIGELPQYIINAIGDGVVSLAQDIFVGPAQDIIKYVDNFTSSFSTQDSPRRKYDTNNSNKFSGGNGADVLFGNGGNDTIGGNGDDGFTTYKDPDLIDGGAGNDSLTGGRGNDTINGGSGNDIINGGAENDLIYGGYGNDNLDGSSDLDTIVGGAGNDYLDGGTENDYLFGEAGNDVLKGGDWDLFGSYHPSGNDYLDGGIGNDYLNGGVGNDTLYGRDGDDVLQKDGGYNIFGGWPPGQDKDIFDGGPGNDTAEIDEYEKVDVTVLQFKNGRYSVFETYTATFTGISASLSTGKFEIYGDIGIDLPIGGFPGGRGIINSGTLANIENIVASNQNDTLTGNTGNNVLTGLGGSDYLDGGSGDDILYGEKTDYYTIVGNDTLLGGSGSDKLYGNKGNDYLNGGDGNDILVGGSGADVFLLRGGIDHIQDFSKTENDKIYFDTVLGTTYSNFSFNYSTSSLFFNGTQIAVLDKITNSSQFSISADVVLI